MSKNYFCISDDFEKIILRHIKSFDNITKIQTGWTNFVFRVESNKQFFYFRFPRNNFFANALIKECEIQNYIKDKISFKTPELNLFFDKRRPYSIHNEVEGKSLSDCYNDLSFNEKKELANDICKLLKEFSLIKIDDSFQRVSNFLDNLSNVSKNNYDLRFHNDLKNLEEKNMFFSHGDFNPGNLILKKNKLFAVIDFSFAGRSNEFVDLSRIAARLPNDFRPLLFSDYEKIFEKKVDLKAIENLEKTWHYVEEKYVLYIKQNHPDIVLPSLV